MNREVIERDLFNETSEEDDSFREMFPGQTKYELSNHNLSIKSMDQSKKSISIEASYVCCQKIR